MDSEPPRVGVPWKTILFLFSLIIFRAYIPQQKASSASFAIDSAEVGLLVLAGSLFFLPIFSSRFSARLTVRDSWPAIDAAIASMLALCCWPALWMPAAVALAGAFVLSLPRPTGRIGSALILHPTLFLIIGLHYGIIGRETGALIRGDFLSKAFDSLGQNLLNGSAEVELMWIKPEEHVSNGGTHMVFGPFPAFLRIALNSVWPELSGKWAGLSSFLGVCAALLGFGMLTQFSLLKREFSHPQTQQRLLDLLLLSFGLGTPLLFLSARSHIYHEAIIWGLSLSLCAIAALAKTLSRSPMSCWNLAIFSTLAGATLLARVSFGVPQFLIIFGVALYLLKSLELKRLGALLIPAAIALSIQLWYNNERFGSVFTFVDMYTYSKFVTHASEIDHFRKIGLIDPLRLRSSLPAYFGINPEVFSGQFPFLQIPTVSYAQPDKYLRYKEWIISLLVTAPWLLALAVTGLRVLSATSALISIAFLPECALILTYYFITQRYSADFLPLLIFLASLSLRSASVLDRKWFRVALSFLCCYSIAATMLSTGAWIASDKSFVPREMRDAYRQRIDAVQRLLD